MVDGVSKGFGDRLLIDALTFKLPAGGIVGVIGPNGAGKTTLFRMLVGQEQPDAGTLRVGDPIVAGAAWGRVRAMINDKGEPIVFFRDGGQLTALRLADGAWRTRGYGDFLSHMLVAEGAVDVAVEPDLAPWDVAALLPIVVAAGGRVSGTTGADVIDWADGAAPPSVAAGLISSNALLHDEAVARYAGSP